METLTTADQLGCLDPLHAMMEQGHVTSAAGVSLDATAAGVLLAVEAPDLAGQVPGAAKSWLEARLVAAAGSSAVLTPSSFVGRLRTSVVLGSLSPQSQVALAKAALTGPCSHKAMVQATAAHAGGEGADASVTHQGTGGLLAWLADEEVQGTVLPRVLAVCTVLFVMSFALLNGTMPPNGSLHERQSAYRALDEVDAKLSPAQGGVDVDVDGTGACWPEGQAPARPGLDADTAPGTRLGEEGDASPRSGGSRRRRRSIGSKTAQE